MEKLNFLPSANNEEHLARHLAGSLVVGSKALKTTTKNDISKISAKFDRAYQEEIEKYGNPGRKVFGVEADKPVGTDAIVAAEELPADKVFHMVREPGTRGENEVKVALIEAQDMPKTKVIHAIYGPTGNGGVYTMMFGDPGEPFPRELPADTDDKTIALNKRAEEYLLEWPRR